MKDSEMSSSMFNELDDQFKESLDIEDDIEAEVRAYSTILAERQAEAIDNVKEEEMEELSSDEGSMDQKEIAKCMKSKTMEITKPMPWMERLDITSEAALNFSSAQEVHDDLKREVVFYDCALESVMLAKKLFEKENVPFSRPDDFFCEMVKGDEHMAKVKDRLVFESKKINAVEQRKSNQENKLRSKELKSRKLEAKASRKKEHFKNIEKWTSRESGGAIDDNDEEYMQQLFTKKNKTRKGADRKYGFGGKKGRYKDNSLGSKDLNDYNPSKGGMVKTGKRLGKRARDANKAKRKG